MLTPEVLEAMGRINEILPSADGSVIVFTLAYESIEENKSNAEIYRINADGTELKRITTSASSESNLRWLEDGKRIAYLGKDSESGKMQIFAITVNGDNIERLSNVENGVDCFEFSPALDKVVYASQIKPFNKNEKLFEGLPATTGRLVDDLNYKHWDEWVSEIPHPFVAEFNGSNVGEGKDILGEEMYECPMKPFGGAESFAWSKDGNTLIYVCRKAVGLAYAQSTDSNLYAYDCTTGKTESLTEGKPGFGGYDTDPKFSPDGSKLAWLSMTTPGYESDKKRLMVMDMKSKEVRDLTDEWDYWPESFSWAPDGKTIVFNAYYQGTAPIWSIDVATKEIKTLADGVCDYNSPVPVAGNKVISLRESMLRPNEICITANGKTTDVTKINDEIFSQLKEVKVEKHLVKVDNNEDMTCWVILPPDFDPNKKYPALLYCQGGPQQAVSQFWSYRWNFRIMAANGYVVIAPNRHGTPGFGTEWNKQISGDYGGKNMRDYIYATEYIASQPYVDEKKVGAVGASYGGFSVYWLAGHNNGHFAALIAHAGMFNLEAQYCETEELWFVNYDLGGPYWEKDNTVAQTSYANSPHKFVNNWECPILVTAGEKDYRILASQGMQAFNAARMHGLEAEMLIFPDENHWIIKPQNAVLWQRTFFNFLDKYLKK